MGWLDTLAAISEGQVESCPAPGPLKNPQDPEAPVNIIPCPICGEGTIGLPLGEPCAICYMEGRVKPKPQPTPNTAKANVLPPPARPCFACKGTNWWWRPPNRKWGDPGEWVCATCHPNPSVLEVAP